MTTNTLYFLDDAGKSQLIPNAPDLDLSRYNYGVVENPHTLELIAGESEPTSIVFNNVFAGGEIACILEWSENKWIFKRLYSGLSSVPAEMLAEIEQAAAPVQQTVTEEIEESSGSRANWLMIGAAIFVAILVAVVGFWLARNLSVTSAGAAAPIVATPTMPVTNNLPLDASRCEAFTSADNIVELPIIPYIEGQQDFSIEMKGLMIPKNSWVYINNPEHVYGLFTDKESLEDIGIFIAQLRAGEVDRTAMDEGYAVWQFSLSMGNRLANANEDDFWYKWSDSILYGWMDWMIKYQKFQIGEADADYDPHCLQWVYAAAKFDADEKEALMEKLGWDIASGVTPGLPEGSSNPSFVPKDDNAIPVATGTPIVIGADSAWQKEIGAFRSGCEEKFDNADEINACINQALALRDTGADHDAAMLLAADGMQCNLVINEITFDELTNQTGKASNLASVTDWLRVWSNDGGNTLVGFGQQSNGYIYNACVLKITGIPTESWSFGSLNGFFWQNESIDYWKPPVSGLGDNAIVGGLISFKPIFDVSSSPGIYNENLGNGVIRTLFELPCGKARCSPFLRKDVHEWAPATPDPNGNDGDENGVPDNIDSVMSVTATPGAAITPDEIVLLANLQSHLQYAGIVSSCDDWPNQVLVNDGRQSTNTWVDMSAAEAAGIVCRPSMAIRYGVYNNWIEVIPGEIWMEPPS